MISKYQSTDIATRSSTMHVIAAMPAVFICLLITACAGGVDSSESMQCTTPQEYVRHAVDTIQTYSLYRDSVDWNTIRADIDASVRNTQTIEKTYRAINSVLRRSGDEHASFKRPAPEGFEGRQVEFATPEPAAELLEGRIGHLIVPAEMSGDDAAALRFAIILQEHIRRLDSNKLCGWVVDLRQNWGGSMWPMLAGLGPLLGDGVAGYFVYPGGRKDAWFYRNGRSRLTDSTIIELDHNGYELSQPSLPIAVLFSDETTSSGEATAVAFEGHPQARSFGTATAGMTTAIEGKTLCDGAVLRISVATYADRNHQIYPGAISPDVVIEMNTDVSSDETLRQASNWILSQSDCTLPRSEGDSIR